jgi:hypothetical protein
MERERDRERERERERETTKEIPRDTTQLFVHRIGWAAVVFAKPSAAQWQA